MRRIYIFLLLSIGFAIAFSDCKSSKMNGNIISVKEFGAIGNGVHDDTKAIQQALDKKGKIFFPQGIYKTEPLTYSSDTHIYGEGNKTEINLFFKTPPRTETIQSVFYPKNIDSQETANVSFSDLVINGNYSNINWKNVKGDGNAHGIATWGTQHLRIERLKIKNCWTDGLYFSGTRNAKLFSNSDKVSVTTVEIENCGRQGISIISLENAVFQDLKIEKIQRTSPKAGIDLEPNNYHPDKIENISFNNVTIKDAGNGFLVSGVSRPKNIKIKNLTIAKINSQYGVCVSNGDNIKLDNLEIDNKEGESRYPLLFIGNSSEVKIKNSKFLNAKGGFAIEVQSGKNTTETDVLMDEIKVNYAKNAGLLVKDKHPKLKISNSDFSFNGVNSDYNVLNINSGKVVLENVAVKGGSHIGAVKLGADNVTFKNCEFEKGRAATVINKNGFKCNLQKTKVGQKRTTPIN